MFELQGSGVLAYDADHIVLYALVHPNLDLKGDIHFGSRESGQHMGLGRAGKLNDSALLVLTEIGGKIRE